MTQMSAIINEIKMHSTNLYKWDDSNWFQIVWISCPFSSIIELEANELDRLDEVEIVETDEEIESGNELSPDGW